MEAWVLVGIGPNQSKAIGPFDNPDQARECANVIGVIPGVQWTVLPLQHP